MRFLFVLAFIWPLFFFLVWMTSFCLVLGVFLVRRFGGRCALKSVELFVGIFRGIRSHARGLKFDDSLDEFALELS